MSTENSKIGSHFPTEIRDRLHKTMTETQYGCGGCAHAEWLDRGKFFVVGVCRFGIKLEHETETNGQTQTISLQGYTPAVLCTAQNAKI